MLQFVGLDERAELVYRMLFSLGAATPAELGERLSMPCPQVQDALAELEEAGLASVSASLPEHFVAAPPAVALGPAISARRHELRQAERAVELLTEEYRRNGAASAGGADLVEVVSGSAAVRHRFEQIQLGAEQELLALATDPPVVVGPAENRAEDIIVARGITHRSVVSRGSLAEAEVIEQLRVALARGQQVRVATSRLPTKLIIADRQLAMLPLRPLETPGEPAVLLVRASGLLQALIGLFEQCWQAATPLRFFTGPPTSAEASNGAEAGGRLEQVTEQPDETDLQIISLLLAGLTDASVAKQLDLGLRTVQRRVQRLMVLTGVTTRMQLGWHAFERGWVAR